MYVVMAGILILSPITQWELPHQHRKEREKAHTHTSSVRGTEQIHKERISNVNNDITLALRCVNYRNHG